MATYRPLKWRLEWFHLAACWLFGEEQGGGKWEVLVFDKKEKNKINGVTRQERRSCGQRSDDVSLPL